MNDTHYTSIMVPYSLGNKKQYGFCPNKPFTKASKIHKTFWTCLLSEQCVSLPTRHDTSMNDTQYTSVLVPYSLGNSKQPGFCPKKPFTKASKIHKTFWTFCLLSEQCAAPQWTSVLEWRLTDFKKTQKKISSNWRVWKMLMNSLCAMPHTHRGRAIFKRIVSHSADLSLKRLLLLRTVV